MHLGDAISLPIIRCRRWSLLTRSGGAVSSRSGRPEHPHIPLSRKTSLPGGSDLPKAYYDAMDPSVMWLRPARLPRESNSPPACCWSNRATRSRPPSWLLRSRGRNTATIRLGAAGLSTSMRAPEAGSGRFRSQMPEPRGVRGDWQLIPKAPDHDSERCCSPITIPMGGSFADRLGTGVEPQ
jgi:hypothetical protein